MHKADKNIRFVYVLTLAGAIICLMMIFLAPLLKNQSPFVSGLLYAVYSPLCHQNPTRCFFLYDYPLAVCTRCLGVYGGFLLGTCCYPLLKDLRSQSLPRKEVLIAVSLPIVIDTAGNLFHFWLTNEWIRFVTGVLWGSILPFFLIPGLIDVLLNKISTTKPGRLPLNQFLEIHK